jgi:hypothetical protein
MQASPGVLIETLPHPGGAGDEWCDWYDQHRLAPRADVPGVVAARRGTALIGSVPHFVDPGSTKHAADRLRRAENIVIYDLADFLAPLSPAWQAADREAGPPPPDIADVISGTEATLYRQIFSLHDGDYVPEPTPVLHTAVFEVPSRHQDEFNDWYNTEHAQFVRDVVDGYRNCRRFQGLEDSHRFVALYDVEALDYSEAKDVHPLNHTPWATRVRSKLPTFRERRLFQIQAAHGSWR